MVIFYRVFVIAGLFVSFLINDLILGCGCNGSRSCNSVAPHNKGVATCHIRGGVTSCSLTCPKGLSFVQDNFNHDNVICTPYGNWSRKEIPGCGGKYDFSNSLFSKISI